MANTDGFEIKNGILKGYNGSDAHITIPDNVRKIECRAFGGNLSLESVIIPGSVKIIGQAAFEGCTNLRSITLSKGVMKIERFAFKSCGIETLELPDGIMSTDDFAFYFCEKLKTVRLPENAGNICGEAFASCKNIKSFEVDSKNKIYSGMENMLLKNGGTELTLAPSAKGKVTVPESVTEIGAGAFAESDIEEAVIGKNVTRIGSYAFYKCRKLKSATVISDNIRIHSYIFDKKDIAFTAPNIPIGNIEDRCIKKSAIETFCRMFSEGIPVPEAMEKNYRLYMTRRRREIYGMAVKNISVLQYMMKNNLIYPEDIDELIDNAEDEGAEIKALLLEYKAGSITEGAADRLYKKQMKAIMTGKLTVRDARRQWTFDRGENGIAIKGYKGSSKEIYVPEYIGRIPVTEIWYYAFSPLAPRLSIAQKEQRMKIKSVELPDTLEVIDGNAFKDCRALEGITIPDSVKAIGRGAFMECMGLKYVKLPKGLKIIDDNTFMSTAISEINLPDSIKAIGEYSFALCSGLTSVHIPENTEEINSESFHGCINLKTITVHEKNPTYSSVGNILLKNSGKEAAMAIDTADSVKIPEGVTVINKGAFSRCLRLNKVSIPHTVREIGFRAFQYCITLKEIFLPSSVERIGHEAFLSCASLRSLYIPPSVKSIGYDIFRYCIKAQIIGVKGSEAERYAKANGIKFREADKNTRRFRWAMKYDY